MDTQIFYTHVEHSPTKTIYIKYYMDKQIFYTHIEHNPSGVYQNNNSPQEIFEKETKKVYSHLQSQKHTFVYASIERKKKLLDDYTYLLEHIHFLSASSSASYLFYFLARWDT